MALHPYAIYFDQFGRKHAIAAEELRGPKKLEEARGQQLFDPTEEFRMSVRGGKTPHFFSLASHGRDFTDTRADNDPAHNQRVEDLLDKLNHLDKNATIELGTRAWNDELKRGEWSPFAELQSYRWSKEVTRALSDATRCRHDLFGMRWKDDGADLNLTGRYPVPRGIVQMRSETSCFVWVAGNAPGASTSGAYYQGGKSIPHPLMLTRHAGSGPLQLIAHEALALTKMDWNNDALYDPVPVTIRYSQRLARTIANVPDLPGSTYPYRLFM